MDKKNKIMIVVVGVFCFILLSLLIYFVFLSSPDENLEINENFVEITIPDVIEGELSNNKKDSYDKDEDYPANENTRLLDSLINLANNKEEEKNKLIPMDYSSNAQQSKMDYSSNAQQSKEELDMFLELQKQIDESTALNNDVAKYNNLYNGADNYNSRAKTYVDKHVTPTKEEAEEIVLNNSFKIDNASSSGFYTTVNENNDERKFELIPAEIVDRKLVYNGTTIAIRTKKSIRIPDTKITIPKDAILYAVVQFQSSYRVNLDIASYKSGKTLYPIDINVVDYDGRPGISLSDKSWLKIPSKVTKDVFDYAYNRGTQANQSAQNGGGGQNSQVSLKEAQSIGVLSSLREISNELLVKRKVLIPSQYEVWLYIK
tara:strand:- start:256 stop:1377 length:1122 start_codon:yes stop_codon:yes gene_type:complete